MYHRSITEIFLKHNRKAFSGLLNPLSFFNRLNEDSLLYSPIFLQEMGY